MTGLNIPRHPFYMRELKLIISMSYGPGRYDRNYEELGHDYPFAYVRWTEKRNIEAFLDLVDQDRLNVERLITHRFSIDEAERAYQLISGQTTEPYLGVLLKYDPDAEVDTKIRLLPRGTAAASQRNVAIGLIGAGGYVPAMLLPHFKSEKAVFRSITTATGLSAHDVGRRFDFALAVSSAEEVLDDADVNLVVIGTRHDSHAELVLKSLSRGKHVFVEKPLALNDLELDRVIEQAQSSDRLLMVGFNRRFSPLALRARDFFAKAQGPLSIIYRINAGRVPRDHWINDPEQGGRIIGEVCHFVDLMQYLTGAAPVSVFAESTAAKSESIVDADSVLITVRFADGSNGVIAYLSEGDSALPKERIEILGGKKAFVIDDFKRATSYEDGHENEFSLKAQDKGQQVQVQTLCRNLINGGPSPIPLDELVNTTRTTFRIVDSLRQKSLVPV